jgi:hypothetical protein
MRSAGKADGLRPVASVPPLARPLLDLWFGLTPVAGARTRKGLKYGARVFVERTSPPPAKYRFRRAPATSRNVLYVTAFGGDQYPNG